MDKTNPPRIGNPPSIALQQWPGFDPALVLREQITIPLQVNGKLRSKIIVPAEASKEEILSLANQDEKLVEWLKGAKPRKVIYVEKKLINYVI